LDISRTDRRENFPSGHARRATPWDDDASQIEKIFQKTGGSAECSILCRVREDKTHLLKLECSESERRIAGASTAKYTIALHILSREVDFVVDAGAKLDLLEAKWRGEVLTALRRLNLDFVQRRLTSLARDRTRSEALR